MCELLVKCVPVMVDESVSNVSRYAIYVRVERFEEKTDQIWGGGGVW